MSWRAVAAVTLLFASMHANGAVPVEKVRIDTHAVERVLDASRRSAPTDVLRRIVLEDIEMLRGSRPDGTYDYAFYDRYEAERQSEAFSVQPRKEGDTESAEVKGAFVYRIVLEVPSRRLLVTRNRRVWVERVEVDFIAQGQSSLRSHVVEVKAWLEPGSSRSIDLPEIARQMTARAIVRADTDTGYGNLVLTTIQARIIDDAKSPYASAVSEAKTLLRAIDRGEAAAIREAASAMRAALPQERVSAAPELDRSELQRELERIQDLLTGTDAEKRDGLERLHQLVRRVRVR